MKKIFLLVFALLLSCISSAQKNFNFKKDHDALLVSDIETSARFYQDVLGLEEISNAAVPSNKRWFKFSDDVELHLSQTEDEVPKNKSIHMAITTQEIDEFIDFLDSKDIYYENWTGEEYSVRIRPDGVKQIYIRDPDGYWIEVNNN